MGLNTFLVYISDPYCYSGRMVHWAQIAVVYCDGGASLSLFAAGSVPFTCQFPFCGFFSAVHAAPRRALLGVRVALLRGRMRVGGAQKSKFVAATLALRLAYACSLSAARFLPLSFVCCTRLHWQMRPPL